MAEKDLPPLLDPERINGSIIEDLIDAYNRLLLYVADSQGFRHDGWDWVLKEPKESE